MSYRVLLRGFSWSIIILIVASCDMVSNKNKSQEFEYGCLSNDELESWKEDNAHLYKFELKDDTLIYKLIKNATCFSMCRNDSIGYYFPFNYDTLRVKKEGTKLFPFAIIRNPYGFNSTYQMVVGIDHEVVYNGEFSRAFVGNIPLEAFNDGVTYFVYVYKNNVAYRFMNKGGQVVIKPQSHHFLEIRFLPGGGQWDQLIMNPFPC